MAGLLALTIGIFLQTGHYYSANGIVHEYSLRQTAPILTTYSAVALGDLRDAEVEELRGDPDNEGDPYGDATCTFAEGGESNAVSKASVITTLFTAGVAGAAGVGPNGANMVINPTMAAAGDTHLGPCSLKAAEYGDIQDQALLGCGFIEDIQRDILIPDPSAMDAADALEAYSLQRFPYNCVPLTEAQVNQAYTAAKASVHECSARANGQPMHVDPDSISVLLSDSRLSIKHLGGCTSGFNSQDRINHDDEHCDVLDIPVSEDWSRTRFANSQIQRYLPCSPLGVPGGAALATRPDCPQARGTDNQFNPGPQQNNWNECQTDRFESDSCDESANFVKEQAAAIAIIMALLALSCKTFSLLIFVAEDEGVGYDGFSVTAGAGNGVWTDGWKTACSSFATVLAILYSFFTAGAFITQVTKLATAGAVMSSDGECLGKYLRTMGYHEVKTTSGGYTVMSVFVAVFYAAACIFEIVNLAKHRMKK